VTVAARGPAASGCGPGRNLAWAERRGADAQHL